MQIKEINQLKKEIENILSDWYDTDFIPVKNPKSDDFLYVTVDGNRRITLTEVSDREVRARFTDLLTEKKIKK